MSSAKNDLYKDLPKRIDTILGDDQHLHRLKQLADARTAWMKEFGQGPTSTLDTQTFAIWLRDRWGLELQYNAESLGLTGYHIIDEQKHLLFTMVFP